MKKKNRSLLGYVLVLVGVGLLLFPQIFTSSFLGAILPAGGGRGTGAGDGEGGTHWATVNSIITPKQPFVMGLVRSVSTLYDHPMPRSCTAQFLIDEKIITTTSYDCVDSRQTYAAASNAENFRATLEFGYFVGLSGKKSIVVLEKSETDWRYVTTIEVWIDDSKCVLSPGYFWAIEQFKGGRNITTNDLRFKPAAFCAERPIFVYEMGNLVEQKVEEMSFLTEGYITIPAGQLWEISYIVAESDAPDLVVDCGPDASYDAAKDVCIKQPVVVFACSGTLTPEGECIKQLTTRCVDEAGNPVEGAFYDVEDKECIKVVPTQLRLEEVDCPSGSTLEVSSEGIRKCVFKTAPEYECDGRLDFSTTPPKCFGFVDYDLERVELISAKAGMGGSNIFIIITGILIIGLGVYLLFKRKK